MTLLTDKAKQDFYDWSAKKGLSNFNPTKYSLDIAEAMAYSIVVEWLDSVGIYIQIKWLFDDNWIYEFKEARTSVFDPTYKSRNEATKAAILTANKIYDERH